jgi:hypothetical protein
MMADLRMLNKKLIPFIILSLFFIRAENSHSETQDQILTRVKSIESLVLSSSYGQAMGQIEQLKGELETLIASQLLSALPEKVGKWQAFSEAKVDPLGAVMREYKIPDSPGDFILQLTGESFGLAGIQLLCNPDLPAGEAPVKLIKGRRLVIVDERFRLDFTLCLKKGALVVSSRDLGMRSEIDKVLELIDYDSIEKALASVK